MHTQAPFPAPFGHPRRGLPFPGTYAPVLFRPRRCTFASTLIQRPTGPPIRDTPSQAPSPAPIQARPATAHPSPRLAPRSTGPHRPTDAEAPTGRTGAGTRNILRTTVAGHPCGHPSQRPTVPHGSRRGSPPAAPPRSAEAPPNDPSDPESSTTARDAVASATRASTAAAIRSPRLAPRFFSGRPTHQRRSAAGRPAGPGLPSRAPSPAPIQAPLAATVAPLRLAPQRLSAAPPASAEAPPGGPGSVPDTPSQAPSPAPFQASPAAASAPVSSRVRAPRPHRPAHIETYARRPATPARFAPKDALTKAGHPAIVD